MLKQHLLQTKILYAVWYAYRNYMHGYSTATMGAVCFMYANRHMIYRTINKNDGNGMSSSYFFGVNESLNHK